MKGLKRQGGWIGSAISAVGSLIGGRQRNQASAKGASKQIAFQERMSNTAMQRRAKDLEKAGLNRILALGESATTPSGAMPTVEDEITPAVTSAQNAYSINQQVRESAARVEALKAELPGKQLRGSLAQDARDFLSNLENNSQDGRHQQAVEHLFNTTLESIEGAMDYGGTAIMKAKEVVLDFLDDIKKGKQISEERAKAFYHLKSQTENALKHTPGNADKPPLRIEINEDRYGN
jgi:hypothetical protein